MTRLLAYCTNVHAGETLEQTMANLDEHAVAVRERVCPGGVLGVGLWLSARAARDAVERGRIAVLRDFLAERGLSVFTMNGFPYGDFHRDVVKHAVYEPAWSDPRRTAYTADLAAILAGLLGEGDEGSISTLPIGWAAAAPPAGAAREELRRAVAHLAQLHDRTGRLLHLDLEPEPGCVIGDAAGVLRWLEPMLEAPEEEGARLRRHLRVCHDVCHAAVMHDDEAAAFDAWDQRGLAVGKVQVSSAVRVDLDALDARGRAEALAALGRFSEPRYLHQTTVRTDGTVHFYEDLPAALAARAAAAGGEWRVHFHVPIDAERLGPLGTTRAAIPRTLGLLADRGVRHFEVETYAWDVLPPEHRRATLADGIAGELAWLREAAAPGYFAP